MTDIQRKTKETDIKLSLNVQGSGKSKVATGIGFFDHMLEAFAKHSLCDIDINCKGDLHVDYHHTVEDVGIVMGEAINKEIFPIKNVERFSQSVVILDEAAVEVNIDLSGRPYLLFDIDMDGKTGEFDTELVEEFFRALAYNAKISVHIVLRRGKNRHHIIEAAFKAFGVAFRRAMMTNDRMAGTPSTKGVL